MRDCGVYDRFAQCVHLNGDTGTEVLFRLITSRANGSDDLSATLAGVLKEVFQVGQLGNGALASLVFSGRGRTWAYRYHKPLWCLTRTPPHSGRVSLRDPRVPRYVVDLSSIKDPDELAYLVASTPLTSEDWKPIEDRWLMEVRPEGLTLIERI
jgi:predicted glutamine amidotransferase